MECVSSQRFKRFFLENFWQAAVSLRFLSLNLSVLDLLLADGLHGKPRNYRKVFIRSIKFNRTELMFLKRLSKKLFTFRSLVQKLLPAKSNNYQHVKSDKLSIVLVLYLLLCILCIYFWHQFRCYIYSYNDRMLLQIYVTPTTLLAVEIIHCNFMVFLTYHGPEESRTYEYSFILGISTRQERYFKNF